MALMRAPLAILATLVLMTTAQAQAPAPARPMAAGTGAADMKDTEAKSDAPDTWIFAGTLSGSKETFSGTLVAGKGESEFELKLGSGATCDGGQLKGDIGLVRLPEITCTDDRKMRALFVPQGGKSLKVFGHVGDDRFMAEAHLLGTEPIPEPQQTLQPKGPLGLPPAGAPR